MNENVERVLNGFFKLSQDERSRLLNEITLYSGKTYSERSIQEKQVEQRSSVGPKNSICKCCGR